MLTQAVLATFLISAVCGFTFGPGNDFQCHCAKNSTCNPNNGFCSEGCQPGWYGPGCQIGNLAYGKDSMQSSTYTDDGVYLSAGNAVDGTFPGPGNYTAISCTHTEPYASGNAWWYVVLDTQKLYVIRNITIINRQALSDRLSGFYILVTNSTEGVADRTNWTQCAYQASEPAYVSTYDCLTPTTARRIAVYLENSKSANILTLCEVYVSGFEYKNCSDPYIGPGCLLQKCTSADCLHTNGTSCDQYGTCVFPSCPKDSHWPPECWQTMPSLASQTLMASVTCDSINVTIDGKAAYDGNNLAPTSIILTASQLNTVESNTLMPNTIVNNTQMNLTSTGGNAMSVQLKAQPGQRYGLFLTPFVCMNGACHPGPASNLTTALTGIRTWYRSENASCLAFSLNSTTESCSLPTSYSVTCSAADNSSKATSNTTNICGLQPNKTYSCSVLAVLSGLTSESYLSDYGFYVQATVNPPQASSEAAIIGGAVAASVVFLVIIISILVVFCKRCKLTAKRNAGSPPPANFIVSHGNCAYASAVDDVASVEAVYENIANMTEGQFEYNNIAGMTEDQFEQYIKNEEIISKKFQELSDKEMHPCTVGSQPENKPKNRFQNMVPYDRNRVILYGPADDGKVNYISASYIDGFAKSRQYIATQGPLLRTVVDFWEMVWQEETTVIVMLTDYFEQSKQKCERYFPKPMSENCDIDVVVKSSVVFDTHTMTKITLNKAGQSRLIHHCHFLSWPDHSVPEHCAQLLMFRRKVNALAAKANKTKTAPIIVHCSAGVGRTGTYIAIDAILERFQVESRVDAESCVLRLRDQRIKMVQTLAQYLFVHRCVLYGMKTGKYILTTEQLTAYSNIIFTREWQVLQDGAEPLAPTDFETALLLKNASRNRTSAVLARESKRPFLHDTSNGAQAYINAVYCNGCYASRGFVATQLPLTNTVNDLWQLIHDSEASCIVLLHELPADKTCPRYWPAEGKDLTCGSIVVTCSKEQSFSDICLVSDLEIRTTSKASPQVRAMSVSLFLLKIWPASADLPTDVRLFLKFANVFRDWRKADDARKPVIVQCLNGDNHSGLFIAAINALDRLLEDGLVQVFHTVVMARTSREQFIKDKVQYQFIYDVLLLQSGSSSIYDNA